MDFSDDFIGQFFQHRLHQDDLNRLRGVISTAERDSLLDKIADIVSKLSALLEVTNRVSDTLSLDVLLKRMIEIITNVTVSDRSTLFLNDPETNELYSRVAQGNLTKEIRFPNHLGIAGEAFTSGKAVIIPDAYADARFNPQVDKKTGYRTRNIMTAPIRTKQNEIIGVVQVLNKLVGDFDREDLVMLEAIAAQAASAIYNAQLYEQVKRAYEEETRLLEISSALSSELNLGRLLAKIMDTTKYLLDADRCTLFMYDEKTEELWSQVAQDLEIKEIRFPAHLGIAGSVFTSGQTINIPDAYADERFNPQVDKKTGYRTRSILCMPLKNKAGQVIGVTQVLNKKGGPFTARDERRLAAFSSQASIAIENAQLFEDVLNMKNYNESMLESMSNGVISLDDSGCIIKLNSAALQILAVEKERIIGRPAEEYFSDANSWIIEGIKRVKATNRPDITLDTDLTQDSGSVVSVNLTIAHLVNTRGETIGCLLVLEDITREKRLKGTMARYMAKEVAERLLTEEGEEALGGQSMTATILFSDIRSFTTISEQLGPQATVSMLNDYFTLMVDIIFSYQGVLDKYIGDAIMAVFGAPITTRHDSENAVNAAIDMMTALRHFNQEQKAQGQTPIQIGIGISTDEILSGNIGSLKRMDYTVIGDGVNLASRLEGANKYYGTRILISEATFKDLKKTFLYREIDLLRVKGKNLPVAVYQILDYHNEETFPGLNDVLALFQEGLDCYKSRDWLSARKHFQQVLRISRNDTPSQIYLERCRIFLENPPPDDWDGVFILKSK